MQEQETTQWQDEALLSTDFFQEMRRQLLSHGGVREGISMHKMLEPFLVTPEMRQSIPIVGDPSPATLGRLRCFYNAIAVLIEKECGLMARPLLEMNPEGFGTLLIVVGKLVAVDRVLRDVHRFGFADLSRMKHEADKLLAVALQRIGEHGVVAGL
ncbi:MAG: NifX-associated nitrogen fixation protein [Magnetococcales bacterium]|nr:NifX-associated nitrogen fixation protein [Magnetococcales bacterium]MBF0271822.1 NifX-associated nitrogen fixation protein [Magnetococcales bacterium]